MRTNALTRSSSVDTTWRTTRACATAAPDRSVLLLGHGQEPAAELGVARIDEHLLARLRVLHEQQPGVGELVLRGIDQPDGDDLVPFGEAQQRSLPSGFADEVGDQHHQRPAADDCARRCRAAC